MKVWRVTGADGVGFYFTQVSDGLTMSQAVSNEIGRDIGSMDSQHPRPSDDGIYNITGKEFFGFSSLDQLHRWFDPEMFSASCKQGAMLEVWEVRPSKVKNGRRQVCFYKDGATRIEFVKLEKYKRR